MSRSALLVTSFAALLLSACGGASTDSSSASPAPAKLGKSPNPVITLPVNVSPGAILGGGTLPDACTSLSATAAGTIASDANLVKLAGTNTGQVNECIYGDPSTGAGATILLEQIPGVVGAAVIQGAIAQASHDASGSNTPVSGIGDQAFKTVQANGATVAFSKGNTLVVVDVNSATRDGTSIESDLESLCKQIAGQL